MSKTFTLFGPWSTVMRGSHWAQMLRLKTSIIFKGFMRPLPDYLPLVPRLTVQANGEWTTSRYKSSSCPHSSIGFPSNGLPVKKRSGVSFMILYSKNISRRLLLGMTIDPACAPFAESSLGPLTPWNRGDFVVLSRDIVLISSHQVLETKVIATVIDGKVAYGEIY